MRNLFIILFVFIVVSEANAQRILGDKLDRFGNKTAIMFYRQDIDEMPLWSVGNKYLAVNIKGDWFAFDLQYAKFQKTKMDGMKVGILKNLEIIDALSDELIPELKESTNFDIRKLELKSGKKIAIESDLFASTLYINGNDLMKLKGNCHSLSVSSDEKYLAFISELNGLIVLEL